MEYRVKVTVGKRKESVTTGRDGRLLVTVSAPREEGKANERMRELVARHFQTLPGAVTIRSGHTSATKIVFVKSE